MAFMDHQETFLSNFFGFIGITDMNFVRAEGVNTSPEQRQRALQSALAEIAVLKADVSEQLNQEKTRPASKGQ
jgi:FMN-dependent NADH-azoreductase